MNHTSKSDDEQKEENDDDDQKLKNKNLFRLKTRQSAKMKFNLKLEKV